MEILTYAGNIYCKLNIDPTKYYTYFDLKQQFLTICSDKHFCIVQENEQLFIDLYDIEINLNKQFKITNLNIVFYDYCKEDTRKVINATNQFLFNIDKSKTLQELFDLSNSELHKDNTFMKFCVNLHGGLLFYGSDEIKNNIEVIQMGLKYIGQNNNIYEYISSTLKDDNIFIINNIIAFKHASDRLKDDNDIVKKIIINLPEYFEFASNRIKSDKLFIITFLSEYIKNKSSDDYYRGYSYIVENLNYELRNDSDVINLFLDCIKIELIDKNYIFQSFLQYIGYTLLNNKNIINKYLEIEKIYRDNCNNYYSCDIYRYIGYDLKYDIEIVKKCLELDSCVLKQLPYEIDLDDQTIISIFNNMKTNVLPNNEEYEYILDFIPEKYKNNKEIVMIAIKCNLSNFFIASERLINDIDIIVHAINYCTHDIDERYKKHINIPFHCNEIKNNIDNIINHTKYKHVNSSDLPPQIINTAYNKIKKNIFSYT